MSQLARNAYRKITFQKIVSFLLAFLFLASPAIAAPGFKSPAHVKRWMKTYYLNPSPGKVATAIRYMSAAGILDKKNAISPVFGFLSGVFQENPGRVNAIIRSLDGVKEHHLGVVVFGLWYSGLDDAREKVESLFAEHPQLAKNFAFLTKNDPRPLVELPLEKGEWILDALWGQFMATGSPDPVRRVISTLPWGQDKKEMSKYLVASAARFSLTANAGQHRKVREIIKAELPLQSDQVQAALNGILNKARKKKK